MLVALKLWQDNERDSMSELEGLKASYGAPMSIARFKYYLDLQNHFGPGTEPPLQPSQPFLNILIPHSKDPKTVPNPGRESLLRGVPRMARRLEGVGWSRS